MTEVDPTDLDSPKNNSTHQKLLISPLARVMTEINSTDLDPQADDLREQKVSNLKTRHTKNNEKNRKLKCKVAISKKPEIQSPSRVFATKKQ